MRAALAGLCLLLATAVFQAAAAERPENSGYCVFGRIVRGTEVVEAMAATPIQSGGDFIGDVPANDLVLQRARLLAPNGN